MPLPGGATDKIGNRYEGRWTVFCMVEVMDEKADSIRLEKPGEDAFEFFVHRNSQVECHQVKRQKSNLGHWTLGALANKQNQVLSDFWQRLRNSSSHCVFISTQDADHLRELADRARSAQSWTEFEQEFLKADQQSTNFTKLLEIWSNCSQIEAYEALKRIRVETVGEEFLLNAIESRLASLVEGDAVSVRLELADLALEKVHHDLTTHDIWHWLEKRGYSRRQWGKDSHILAAVKTVNESYLSSLQEMTIAGHTICRDEVQLIYDRLTNKGKKQSVLVAGEAGVGKTGVTLQVVKRLYSKGFPTLAFRVDNLNPEPMPDKVGNQLGLPASPAIVLANIAQGQDCFLIIDQLDAVSLASGRNPQFYACVEHIIKQAQAYPNMRLLIVCREFDLENDPRFKKLTGKNGIAETLDVGCLSHEKIQEVVAEIGLDATCLTERQLKLLSIPFHLSLLADISQDTDINTLSFSTSKDLLDQFWKYKQARVRERLGRSVQWAEVINILCGRMSHEQGQGLSVPETVVDDYADDARAMASEHVLAWQGKRIRFFHEVFFDYSFARNFTAHGRSLLSFLQSNEQHLFLRAQVRQILLHEREANFERYLTSLSEILRSVSVRFHIKKVIFSWLASLSDPREEEWRIVASLIDAASNSLTQQALMLLRKSVQWFNLVDSLGIIEQWLYGQDEEFIAQVVSILSMMQASAPKRVVELINPFVSTSEIWTERLRNFIHRAELSVDRCLFEFFLRLIREGIQVQISEEVNEDKDFWMQIYSLPNKKPDWACEAIACYLEFYLELKTTTQADKLLDFNSDLKLPQSGWSDSVLSQAASLAPKAFVQFILPFIIRVLELTARHEERLPWQDSVWWFRAYGGGHGTEHDLLTAMEVALSGLATCYPEDFSALATEKLCDSNFETIQFLLIRAYTANGARFANEAIEYLCKQPRRLQTGYSMGNGNVYAQEHWATRQLIFAITPHCSEEGLLCLETLLLNYYDKMGKSPGRDQRYLQAILKIYGYVQMVLLDAIDPSRRSSSVHRRLQEWKRKFNSIGWLETSGMIEPLRPVEASFVDAPIPREVIDKISDAQWVKAIARHSHENRLDFREQQRKWVGSAHELAILLQRQAEKEPVRLARLALQLPHETNLCYFNAILRGCAKAVMSIDVETAFQLIQHCHLLVQHPCGQEIAYLIAKLANLDWSQGVYHILTWYALNGSDTQEELWHTQSNSQLHDGRSILTAGINTVRGSAATAIAKLIFYNRNRTTYFQPVLAKMVSDPSIAVKACVAEALIAVLSHDRVSAIQLFLEMCSSEDGLFGTNTVQHFLYYASQTHFEMLKPTIERMITSNVPDVVQGGSQLACVLSLSIEEARLLANQCLLGSEAHQLGASEIFVKNFRSAHFREFCQAGLMQLFQASTKKVRDQAAKCFLQLEEDELCQNIEIANQFVQSSAFINNSHILIWALEKTTAKLPELTCFVCEHSVRHLREQTNEGNRVFRDVESISRLLVKTYSQSSKKLELQASCLDMIDQLSEMEVYGLDKALELFER
jgi:hypothetical protein